MAITLPASQHFLANNKVTFYDFDPDSADPVDVTWVDMRDYAGITIVFVRTIGTGALDTFKILGNPASDGSGTDVTLKTHAVGSEPNLIPDYLFLEVTAQEIAAESGDDSNAYRYVTASCEFATSTDEAIVGYFRWGAKQAQLDLTADLVQ